MAYLNDRVLDYGLNELSANGKRLDICSALPETYAEATSTYTLGNKANISIGAPATRVPSGRKITVSQITDGSVTGTGTAAAWAITDTTNSRLLAAGSLSASQSVTSGNTFTLAAFDIGIPAPVE